MNDQQAQTEARRRWGKAGAVRKHRDGSRSVGTAHQIDGGAELGRVSLFTRKGHGANWGEAFRQCDRVSRRATEYLKALRTGSACPRCDHKFSSAPHSANHPMWLLEEKTGVEDQLVCAACCDEWDYGVRIGHYARMYIRYLESHREHGPRGSRLEYAGNCWEKLAQRTRGRVVTICRKKNLPLHDDPTWEKDESYANNA